ncbi:MAG: DNA polymerase III subunit delta [Chloroflexi bacterium RBG_16_51_16]|nr:MAG: DNA polymerase III subunit delta [Chloroflexi bacterium RBG_16_51_16]
MIIKQKIVFLFGNDEYAITRQLKEIESEFASQSAAEMNLARLDGRALSDDQLNNAVNAIPFLAEYRLVSLSNPSASYTTPEARRKFCEFLENVPITTRVVLYEMVEPKRADKHWLVTWSQKKSDLVGTQSFMLPAVKSMTGWIINEVRNQKGHIEQSAAGKLAEMVGADTRQAAQEISKLLAYVNWERPINGSDVAAVSIVSAEQSVFDFVDSLAVGDSKTAQALLRRLLETEDPFSLWGMVIRQFRLLILTREILDNGGKLNEVQRQLNLHPFVAGKMTAQAKRYTLGSLESIYHRLLEIDEAVKTGQLTLDLALEMLVVEFAG